MFAGTSTCKYESFHGGKNLTAEPVSVAGQHTEHLVENAQVQVVGSSLSSREPRKYVKCSHGIFDPAQRPQQIQETTLQGLSADDVYSPN